MQDIDLSGVDPRRWGETRRRIEIIREWIAGGRHTKQEGDEYAERIGLNYKQFMRLVSAWKKHGDPTKLDGAGMKRGERRDSRMPEATSQAVLDAIAALGPDARFVDVAAEAGRRCRDASTPAASTGMIHYLLMRARQQAGPRTGDQEILIGRVGCRMPTIIEDRIVPTPELIVAVLAPEGIIIAHELVVESDRLAAAASVLSQVLAQVLPEALAQPASSKAWKGRPIILAKELDVGSKLARSMPALLKVAPGSPELARLLGSYIGTIPIRHRIRAANFAPAAVDAPLAPADARRAIGIAVQAHNTARSA